MSLTTTHQEFWQSEGFNQEDSVALANNVQEFISESLDEEQENLFSYSAEYADDYKSDYVNWAKRQNLIK